MKAEELGGDPAGEYGGGEEAEAMISLCEATIRGSPSGKIVFILVGKAG